MGKHAYNRGFAEGAFYIAAKDGRIPPPPSAEALWMHFTGILADPIPFEVCVGLSNMLRNSPGNLYLSDGYENGKVSVVGMPRAKGDLPFVVDNRPCGPHRCLQARVRAWKRTADYRRYINWEPTP